MLPHCKQFFGRKSLLTFHKLRQHSLAKILTIVQIKEIFIGYNFNSLSTKSHLVYCISCTSPHVMQEITLFSRKIYTVGKNFTRPPVVTVPTNLNSGLVLSVCHFFALLELHSNWICHSCYM